MATSVLFLHSEDRLAESGLAQPDFFIDLNVDQIVTEVITGKDEYNLAPFFLMPLRSVDAVKYRQEVLKDLEAKALRHTIKDFAEAMHGVRNMLAETEKRYYEHQNERWFLDAADLYVTALQRLATGLKKDHPSSRGLQAFQKYLAGYLESPRFKKLASQTNDLEKELKAIRYELRIEGLRVELHDYQNEPNYSTEIQHIFERFSHDGRHALGYGFRERTDMSQVEGRILDLLAELYSDTFHKLAAYHDTHAHFMDTDIVTFDREIQFYIAYLVYVGRLNERKLTFCYPSVSSTSKAVSTTDSFDIALAHKLASEGKTPVTNDFYLKDEERIIVVSGPNQGGKTTFARTFGQLHYLASLGLLVPGSKANLYLPDTIYTHFEREERMTNLRGKLEDDLVRADAILSAATPRSIILINEIFTSTTLHDAILLSQKIGTRIMKLDALCVWVTFIDEVASLGRQTVSMVSTVVPDKPAERTFKVVRRPADGLAYALSIAEKYKLTSTQLEKRIHG